MSDLTDRLWERFGTLTVDDLPADVATVAHHCVLDWLGCAVAGSREPLSGILRDELATETGACSLVGSNRRADPLRAAMLNGAAGHALDFDDTSQVMGGHASVPLLPAVLAAAEAGRGSGADVVAAYATGMEVQARIGAAIGADHYRRGWHTTSTIGVFGAAAGVARLLQLDAAGFGTAMGIAASSASGLKANFGTMTKPLHPGQAAERGLLAARLAAAGYTADSGAVDGNQGFAQAAGDGALDDAELERWTDRWATPRTLFKLHAACHLTHAGIEATSSILGDLDADEIDEIRLTVNPGILDVCGIPEPQTGLEAKFSLTGTQALVAHGADTAAVETFADEPIRRPEVQAFLGRVVIDTDPSLPTMATRVALTAGGSTVGAAADVSRPAADLDAQGARLRTKFVALAGPVLGGERARLLADRIDALTAIDDVGELLALTR
ncbi:MAG: MmgE/PrpD family protein [Actinomycetota bacterium]